MHQARTPSVSIQKLNIFVRRMGKKRSDVNRVERNQGRKACALIARRNGNRDTYVDKRRKYAFDAKILEGQHVNANKMT